MPATIQHKTYCLRVVLAIIAGITLVIMGTVTVVALVNASNANAAQRYCVVGNDVFGFVQTDINDRDIHWELQYTPAMGTITSVYVMGPIPYGVTEGPFDFALCGSPSSLSCDLTVPHYTNGHITELAPSGTSLKVLVQAIRNEPWRYYLQINRGAGASIRLPLDRICGTI